MFKLILVGILIFFVSVAMTMVGKGGGNFYVVILALTQIPIHEAATTGQFILLSAFLAAIFIFQKNKTVSWPLAILYSHHENWAGNGYPRGLSGGKNPLAARIFLWLTTGTLSPLTAPTGKPGPGKKRSSIFSTKKEKFRSWDR